MGPGRPNAPPRSHVGKSVEQVTTLATAPVEEELAANRERALGELFDAHQGRLFRLARRLSRDPEEARDLVQETFLRLARHRVPDRLEGEVAERWLVRVLVNLCRDRQRRERVRRRHAAEAGPPPISSDDLGPAVVARATVAAALAKLPARRRAVIVLHELEDRGTPEIAKLLGLSQVTVRWHLHAGRRQLRTILGGREDDHER